jgi:serine phosphatase RsbU (regulator of sigma subunit)/anti-sigma regulatory factor (Ser/Thr protein kinase)
MPRDTESAWRVLQLDMELEVDVASEDPAGIHAAPDSASGRIESLDSLADASLGYMSLEAMLAELLERVRTHVKADTAAILLLDEERGVLVARAARGLEEEVRQGVRVPLARGFAGRVAAERRPIVIEDLAHADVVNPILRQKGIRSMLGVPIHVEGRVIGVMHVGTLHERRFDDGDVSLVQLAADRAALAIDNARLAEQRAATEIVQRTLLPDALPDIAGFRFSAKYLPGGTGIKVGGDWYDVFQLSSGRIAFVIGDVVGRGVLAASVMAEIRTALRAYLIEGHELTRTISLLNKLLVAMGGNRSATAAICGLDPELGRLEVVSAGHLPVLLIAPDGAASFLEPLGGLPLGISRGDFEVGSHEFPAGSALLLYTDGLVERRGEPIDEGLERLRLAAEHAFGEEDTSLADRVYRALIDERPLDDDLALLAIESEPLGDELDFSFDAEIGVLPGVRRMLGRWLACVGATEEEQFDLTLATSEAAANAVEHAYGIHRASFTVRCLHADGMVTIRVRDEGRWRASRPYGRGRGLAIMRALVDSVELERTDHGTTVTLAKRLGPPSR